MWEKIREQLRMLTARFLSSESLTKRVRAAGGREACVRDEGDSGDAILGPSRSKRVSLSFIFSSRVALSGACRREKVDLGGPGWVGPA